MASDKRYVLLVQLPIPPPGPGPIRGNVPLAAGYLKLLARNRGLERHYEIEIFPPVLANRLGDEGLVAAILDRRPWLVGFTCYLWNIERTLWIARRLKEADPRVQIILGGPEITADNAWVLDDPSIDYAAIGEGEQTFSELLQALTRNSAPDTPIAGLYVRRIAPGAHASGSPSALPAFRSPLPRLDEISSPYLAGILDAADEQMLLLETIRGCVFKCKFCYYPKSYDSLYFLSREKLIANLEHARQRGVREVVLLDPTLNQRRDFAEFLAVLAEHNPGRQFTYFGELRAEGITPAIARLLQEANFTEVEIGLQSIDPAAQELMDRKNNLRAFERGVQALLEEGIQVKVDLIIGLPGDTVDSIRRGLEYLYESRTYSSLQVFNLAILPGTAFRQEAAQLGLEHQPRPPYYVTRTPTLRMEQMLGLMEEAQEMFGVEFDPPPPPQLEFAPRSGDEVSDHWIVDLDRPADPPLAAKPAQAFTLWLRSADLHAHRQRAATLVAEALAANPFTTLQVVLEPTASPRAITPQLLDSVARACFSRPTYLDKFYAVLPGRTRGAKRLVVMLSLAERDALGPEWIADVGDFATIVWRGDDNGATADLDEHELVVG